MRTIARAIESRVILLQKLRVVIYGRRVHLQSHFRRFRASKATCLRIIRGSPVPFIVVISSTLRRSRADGIRKGGTSFPKFRGFAGASRQLQLLALNSANLDGINYFTYGWFSPAVRGGEMWAPASRTRFTGFGKLLRKTTVQRQQYWRIVPKWKWRHRFEIIWYKYWNILEIEEINLDNSW